MGHLLFLAIEAQCLCSNRAKKWIFGTADARKELQNDNTGGEGGRGTVNTKLVASGADDDTVVDVNSARVDGDQSCRTARLFGPFDWTRVSRRRAGPRISGYGAVLCDAVLCCRWSLRQAQSGRGQQDCALSPGKHPGGSGRGLLYLRYPYFYRRMGLAPTVTPLLIAG